MSVEKNSRTSNEMVREFHETFGHPISDKPDLSKEKVSNELLQLRLELIAEEFFELIDAAMGEGSSKKLQDAWELTKKVDDSSARDIVEVADALGDLEYVIHGFAHVAGIPLPDVVSEIHSSNMSKLGADGKPIYREDGKVLKGPNYFKPNIAKSMGLED